ncbi:hypothetical protein [Pseudomonas sp. F01002]|uniref:hypothetical protein n=1 Tax=Pseudomonas sp. F01002 TaxID=2555724 RepID=UPI001068EEC1|nr:hypothetical protein [Pseudomonas sp. F01002]TFB38831.1 hypothetical protein E3W21_18325 [Pseudomonas sp. F01002]
MNHSNDELRLTSTRGSVDYNFGVAGKVYLYDGPENTSLHPRAIHVFPDGKMLCAASSESLQMTYLIMLDERGVIDEAFGMAGKCRFKVPDYFPSVKFGQPFALQYDHKRKKIVMGFYAAGDIYTPWLGAARFDLNGSLDQTFGVGGVMVCEYDLSSEELAALSSRDNSIESPSALGYSPSMVVMEDGSIMFSSLLTIARTYAVLTRVDCGGVLDRSFGGRGFVIINHKNRSTKTEDLIRQGEKVLLAANSSRQWEGEWFVGRYNADGSLDESFATGGYYDSRSGVKSRLLWREDEKELYIIGTSANTAGQHLYVNVQRIGVDGQEDPHYGDRGWSGSLDNSFIGQTVIWQVALYNSGSTIVLAGHVELNSNDRRTVIASIEQDMGWDGAFGNEGRVMLGAEVVVHALAVQADRKVVYISSANNALETFAINRLHG